MNGIAIKRWLAAVLLLGLMAPIAAADEWIYVVQPGDNPWTLTQRFLAGVNYWPRLQRHNKISDPLSIAPGTRLRLPIAWLRPEQLAVQVSRLKGEVLLMRSGRPAQPLSSGATIRNNDTLRTATGASVELQFADGSRLRLLGDSEFRVLRHVRFANTDLIDTRVQLLRGRSETLVRSANGRVGRFEIDTPAAVTSVRGTHFRVGAATTMAFTEVLEGEVRVANDAASVDAGARTGTVVATGHAPAAPTPLLPAPDPDGVPAEFEQLPLAFSLPPLAGAMQYRLQIADSAEFSTLLHDAVSGLTDLRMPKLPDGEYHLRVRGIDEQRLEGLDSVHRVRVNTQPEPPILIEPVRGARVLESRPRFRWALVAGAGDYRFELARDADFATVLFDRAGITDPEVRPELDLDLGTYFWRVTASDQDGRGPIGQGQRLQRIPPPPSVDAPALGESDVLLSWAAGSAGDRYQVQVAADDQFTRLLLDATTTEPQATLPRPQPGIYYVRARARFADGYEGPFGSTQRFEVPTQPPSPWWLLVPLLLLLAL